MPTPISRPRAPKPIKVLRVCACGARIAMEGLQPDIQAAMADWNRQHEIHQTPEYLSAKARERFGNGIPDDFPIVVMETPQGDSDGRSGVSMLTWPFANGHRYRNPIASAEQRGVEDGIYMLVPLT